MGYPCLSLHGGKDQSDRESTINDFKSDVCNLLVATGVAARGLDVKELVLVVNYDTPNHHEEYVHRVGRTGKSICGRSIQQAAGLATHVCAGPTVVPAALHSPCCCSLLRSCVPPCTHLFVSIFLRRLLAVYSHLYLLCVVPVAFFHFVRSATPLESFTLHMRAIMPPLMCRLRSVHVVRRPRGQQGDSHNVHSARR